MKAKREAPVVLTPNGIEAIHLAALAIDEAQKRGTPEHAEALALLEEGRAIWRARLWQRLSRICPHCGKSTR